ncbi:hypothetical protein PIB30_006931 [Stylosanthes scabra]|uniref:RNase H type-1 domain-containing protein n=1 Tax=Stylosanthes scabra TaxID=79078 RepID=A0ABU6X1S6_9FABA|nr:hypothetical protein [Stylosanthes scabra]
MSTGFGFGGCVFLKRLNFFFGLGLIMVSLRSISSLDVAFLLLALASIALYMLKILITVFVSVPKCFLFLERLGIGMTDVDLSLDMLSWVLKNIKQHESLFLAVIWWIWCDRNNDVSSSSLNLVSPSLVYDWIPPPSSVAKSQSSMNGDLLHLLDKIHDVLRWNWSVSVHLIQRTANRIADLLARRAASMKLRYSEWLQPCNFLVSIFPERIPSS